MSDIIRRFFIVFDFVYFTIITLFFFIKSFELLGLFEDLTNYFFYEDYLNRVYGYGLVTPLYNLFTDLVYTIFSWSLELPTFIILVLIPLLFYGLYSVFIPLKYIIFGKILPLPWSILRFNKLDTYRKKNYFSKMIICVYYLILGGCTLGLLFFIFIKV